MFVYPKKSGRRSERNSFKDKHLRKPTDSTTKETRRKQHNIHNKVPRKNCGIWENPTPMRNNNGSTTTHTTPEKQNKPIHIQ